MKSFTLIELVLVIGIVALLAAAMIPFITSARMEAKVARLLATTDTLRDACKMYHSDTGAYAREASSRTGAIWHGLSMNDGRAGWDGPYIGGPVSTDDDPFDVAVEVRRSLGASFDFDGDGTWDRLVGTDGNDIVFSSVPTAAAQLVDEHLDKGIPGNWRSTGRVRFVPMIGTGWLIIYLVD